MSATTLFVTGATSLVGGGAVARMLTREPGLRVYALVRHPTDRLPGDGVVPVMGDLRAPGLGIEPGIRARLAREVDAVLHCAADTRFSQTLEEARDTNVRGTERVLQLAAEWPRVGRVVYLSTAFVAGRTTGRVAEDRPGGADGWVNAYERSKHEAETRVRACGRPWTILRPSTIVYDTAADAVLQWNAIHRALRLCHGGLAPMLPGSEDAPVEVVPSDYVCNAVARLAFHPESTGRTLHLCAGEGSLPLGELLDLSFRAWSEDAAWRRRGVCRPALADLDTYRLFERSVEETGDERLRQVMRSLSHFVPQLAYPKRFDTTGADTLLGAAAPPVGSYWIRMLNHLAKSRWAAPARAVAQEPSWSPIR